MLALFRVIKMVAIGDAVMAEVFRQQVYLPKAAAALVTCDFWLSCNDHVLSTC